jgi:hypothetical protein
MRAWVLSKKASDLWANLRVREMMNTPQAGRSWRSSTAISTQAEWKRWR